MLTDDKRREIEEFINFVGDLYSNSTLKLDVFAKTVVVVKLLLASHEELRADCIKWMAAACGITREEAEDNYTTKPEDTRNGDK